jgi:ribonuclease P/MRP protein subunit POP1
MQKLPKCRKHIRKRRHLVMAYKMRDGKVRWLSTHLWATKRMRMINYHGYKIAFTPNDKSFRSAYRHFRHNSCLIDLSYYQCLCLKVING